MQPSLILVDESDKKLGYGSLEDSHKGKGKRHRAFVTLLVNSRNQVLLQKRKHRLFDGLWDLTAISHPLLVNGKDETYQEASDRALLKEMGISHVEVKKIGGFSYYSQDGQNCENEYCAILVGRYDGKFKPNPKEVYDFSQVDFEDFKKDIQKSPKKYAPWAVLASKQLELEKNKEFKRALSSFLVEFEKFRKDFFKKKKVELKKKKELADFYLDLERFTDGGKKLRAFLVYLGYLAAKDENAGEVPSQLLSICLAVEILHSFFLIHDDVMDRSDKRRGMPTIHKKYEKNFDAHFGTSMAITLGDIASFESIKLIGESRLSDDVKLEILNFVTQSAIATDYGQALDIYGSKRQLKEAEIVEIMDNKTAKYSVVMPLILGAIAGRAGDNKRKAFIAYGMAVGRAFQLQDDILGVFGSENELGKSINSDMREGKNTLLVNRTKKMCSPGQRKVIDKCWGNLNSGSLELEKVKKVIVDCGSLAWCEEQKVKYSTSSKKEIAKITKNKELVSIFNQISDYFASRSN